MAMRFFSFLNWSIIRPILESSGTAGSRGVYSSLYLLNRAAQAQSISKAIHLYFK